MNQTLTVFYTDQMERLAVQPVADLARERGFDVKESTDLTKSCEVGLYCDHVSPDQDWPNAEFAAIMFHGMDQGWYKLWVDEPWELFDVGFVPGQSMAERWHSYSYIPRARPTDGVYDVGWPKSDDIFADAFEETVSEFAEQFDFNHDLTLLYAPTSEINEKLTSFVEAAEHLNANLLVKHAPYEGADQLKNNQEMYDRHDDHPDVHIIDPEVDIIKPLALADVLVSDSSSVQFEALLSDTPVVAVMDWQIQKKNNDQPKYPRKPNKFEFVHRTTLSELDETLQMILSNIDNERDRIREYRDYHFSHLGNAADATLDVIEALAGGETPPVTAIEPLPVDRKQIWWNQVIKWGTSTAGAILPNPVVKRLEQSPKIDTILDAVYRK